DPPARPLEQRSADPAFERAHRLADARSRDAQLGRRTAEVQLAGHRQERLDLPDLHTTIVSPRLTIVTRSVGDHRSRRDEAGRTMGLEEQLPGGFLLTTVEAVAGLARKSSMWPMTFGLACCGMELMATGDPRHDFARFGMERPSGSPRQADLMVVAGRVSQKMAPVLRQLYDQMAAPKWVIAMG